MEILNFGNTNRWKRPKDWLPLPMPEEEGFNVLYFVRPFDNLIKLRVTSDYMVDWGDGTIEIFDSSSIASHEYDFNGLDAPLEATYGFKQVIIKVRPQENLKLSYFTFNVNSENSIQEFKGNLPQFNPDGFTDLFSEEGSLQSVEFKNIPTPTRISNPFYNCYALKHIKGFYPKPEEMTGYLNGVFRSLSRPNKIKEVVFNTTKLTTLIYPLYDNRDIEKLVILGDNSNCSTYKLSNSIVNEIEVRGKVYCPDFSWMFTSNVYLKKIIGMENIVFTQDVSADGAFYNCRSLESIVLDMLNVTSATNFIVYCRSLKVIKLTNIPKIDLDIKSSNISRQQLINIFNGLPDCSEDDTSPVLNISGNTGTAQLSDDDKSIVTNKNWTLIT